VCVPGGPEGDLNPLSPSGSSARVLPHLGNQQEVTVRGSHFIQEDSPAEIGHAVAHFLAKVP
jgi:hypothetical protein